MKYEFEILREKLHLSIDRYGLNSEETRKISEEFNKLVNIYYENEDKKSLTEKNINRRYIDSIKELKYMTDYSGKYPTINEWNNYAKESYLLNSESIKYITGINWHKLRGRIKSEVEKG